jgi:putative restriction endonuclease
MKFWVGITDRDWFDFLSTRSPDEVNFWQPSARPVAQFLEPGSVFLFKLHAPHNYIVGAGVFVRFSVLPAKLAWEAFGPKNGVEDYFTLRARIQKYRSATKADPLIGCNVLNSPVFWPESQWIPVPLSWSRNIVRGRTYDTADADGAALWNAVQERLIGQSVADAELAPDQRRFGDAYLTHARLGQGAFRLLVIDAYQRRCAITGERTLPVLEAAHIRPYRLAGPHHVSNGLLLRADLHKLFDDGYVTLSEDMRVEVSGRIREEFENGRDYYKFAGRQLQVLPARVIDQPSAAFLEWHRNTIYFG